MKTICDHLMIRDLRKCIALPIIVFLRKTPPHFVFFRLWFLSELPGTGQFFHIRIHTDPPVDPVIILIDFPSHPLDRQKTDFPKSLFLRHLEDCLRFYRACPVEQKLTTPRRHSDRKIRPLSHSHRPQRLRTSLCFLHTPSQPPTASRQFHTTLHFHL